MRKLHISSCTTETLIPLELSFLLKTLKKRTERSIKTGGFLKILLRIGISLFFSPFLFVEGLNGESLEQAWEIAIRESNQLKAKQQITSAEEAGLQAARASRLPRITNATSYTVLSSQPEYQIDLSGLQQSLAGSLQSNPALASALGPAITNFPTSISTPILNQDFLISTTQAILPLYTGGKISSLIEQAEARSNAAHHEERMDLLDLKLQVAENYLLVLRLNRMVQLLRETQIELEQHVQHTQSLLQNGIVTENVHLAAQVSRAEIDQKILQAQQNFELSKAAYNRYLYRPLDSPVNLDPLGIPPLSDSLDSQIQLALENRPELHTLSAKAVESNAKAKEFRSERLPNMAAAGGYTYFQDDSLTENNYASFSLCMVWTPLDGGVSHAKQKAAAHQMTAANRLRDEARSLIELQVRQAWLYEREAKNRLEVAKKSVEQASVNLKIVRKQFQQGISPHADYLQAVSLKVQADVNFCDALCDRILAAFKMKRATGTI